jgi:hypothetical protein
MAFAVEVIRFQRRAGHVLKDVQQVIVRTIEARWRFASGIVGCMSRKDMAVQFAEERVASRQLDRRIVLHVCIPRA